PMGVRNLNAEGHALVAKLALSHPLHLLAVVTYRMLALQAWNIVAEKIRKCKNYFRKNEKICCRFSLRKEVLSVII
ncbi:MAG: hypothetical protein IJS55_04275, partial [Oscillospiraceae bacterium]|nr:hypothetical protein [Oscillospiraceae bacterium]